MRTIYKAKLILKLCGEFKTPNTNKKNGKSYNLKAASLKSSEKDCEKQTKSSFDSCDEIFFAVYEGFERNKLSKA
jgi:hypothetical protein